MDTSTEYIKMCDCKEVQDVRPFIADMDDNRHLGCTPTGDFYYGFREKIVWLPRQDQLQEMMLDPKGEFLPCLVLGDWYLNSEYCDVLNKRLYTEEQRWLAYVMKKKFNKAWDGKWL